MSVIRMLLCICCTSFSVHYGWKMRGTVIGGEKGAMLPGMLAGLMLALFAGGEIRETFYVPAAVGLIGMTYGGIEPYGDTIAFIVGYKDLIPDPAKGFKGLALKGALWFGICGGFLGIAFSAMGGLYGAADIILIILLTVGLQITGYLIFNKPYRPDRNRYPRIYFSFESREEWGSNAGIIAALLITALIKNDCLTLSMLFFGSLSGAVGWTVAMIIYIYTEKPMKNGKYLFGVFSRKKLVGGWGNMEYCLGSFGGAGLALGFSVCNKRIQEINLYLKANGFNYVDSKSNPVFLLLTVLLFAGIFTVNVISYLRMKKGKKVNGFISDLIERPLFSTLPLTFILLGSEITAKLMTAFMLLYVLFIKNRFDRLEEKKEQTVFTVCSLSILIPVFIITVFTDFTSPFIPVLCGTVPYVLSQIYWFKTQKQGDSLLKLNAYTFNIILLTVQSILLLVITLII